MISFLFDTADRVYLSTLWKSLKGRIDPSQVLGVTTNPKALAQTPYVLIDPEDTILELCSWVHKVRGDSKGVVYVQYPFQEAEVADALRFAEYLKGLEGDSTIGMKVPPFEDWLSKIPLLASVIDINVTGVTDAMTALRCFHYPVTYVSMLAGRMDEAGADFVGHMDYMRPCVDTRQVISGSMRTVEGLQVAVQAGTVPTIGKHIWDQVLVSPEVLESVVDILTTPTEVQKTSGKFPPHVTDTNVRLSCEFFNTMDGHSKTVYQAIWRHSQFCSHWVTPRKSK